MPRTSRRPALPVPRCRRLTRAPPWPTPWRSCPDQGRLVGHPGLELLAPDARAVRALLDDAAVLELPQVQLAHDRAALVGLLAPFELHQEIAGGGGFGREGREPPGGQAAGRCARRWRDGPGPGSASWARARRAVRRGGRAWRGPRGRRPRRPCGSARRSFGLRSRAGRRTWWFLPSPGRWSRIALTGVAYAHGDDPSRGWLVRVAARLRPGCETPVAAWLRRRR
jgi:hypothetical protein